MSNLSEFLIQQRRPTVVEALSASQFSKMYKSCGKKSNLANEEEENENEEDPEISEPNETSNEINLDYKISLTTEKKNIAKIHQVAKYILS